MINTTTPTLLRELGKASHELREATEMTRLKMEQLRRTDPGVEGDRVLASLHELTFVQFAKSRAHRALREAIEEAAVTACRATL